KMKWLTTPSLVAALLLSTEELQSPPSRRRNAGSTCRPRRAGSLLDPLHLIFFGQRISDGPILCTSAGRKVCPRSSKDGVHRRLCSEAEGAPQRLLSRRSFSLRTLLTLPL